MKNTTHSNNKFCKSSSIPGHYPDLSGAALLVCVIPTVQLVKPDIKIVILPNNTVKLYSIGTGSPVIHTSIPDPVCDNPATAALCTGVDPLTNDMTVSKQRRRLSSSRLERVDYISVFASYRDNGTAFLVCVHDHVHRS